MTRDSVAWRRLGADAALAHKALTKAFSEHVRDKDPARYEALLRDFRTKTAAALPSSDPAFKTSLAAGRERQVDTAIAFLEADPWFFRSGYEKEMIIRHLKRTELSIAQRVRLGRVVIAAVDGRDRREFRHYCRLACVVWSDVLDIEIAKRMESPDDGIKRRAIWVAEAAITAGKA